MRSDMAERYDTIVIGLGAMGSATCWQLARRGNRVLGLEQHDLPHHLGSSHGDTRIIRLSYFEHPDYVPLLQRAYENWRTLEADSERALLYEVGGIYIGPEDGEFISGSRRAARQYDLPHADVSSAQLRERYPLLHPPEGCVGLYEPRAGFVLAEQSIEACLNIAMRHGAHLCGRTPVRSWSANTDGVRVMTDEATFEANHLVMTAGPWASMVMPDLGVELNVTRQVMGWFQPRTIEPFELGTLPVWAIEDGRGGLAYGFPMLPFGRPGVKIARHLPGRTFDPEATDRTPDAQDRDEIETIMRKLLPEHHGPLLSMIVCLYTNTPDGHFVIGRHPQHENVTIGCGFSGHGFKFVSVIGEVLADLARDGHTAQPIDFLRPDRFRTQSSSDPTG